MLFMTSFVIKLDAITTHLWVGETHKFELNTTYSYRNVSWSTIGGYLSLSGSGGYRDVKVTQYFSGSATVVCSYEERIGASTQYQKKQVKWTVDCRDNPIEINPASLTLYVGEKSKLSYSHKYNNSYTRNSNAYFSTANTNVVSVSQDGSVTAKAPGTAFVNVYSKITNGAPYCIITVKEAKATSISLPSTVTIYEGNSNTLLPAVVPSGANVNITWSSDNTSVAKVSSSGKVTAVKEGIANITAKTDNGLSATCKIVVPKGPDQIEVLPDTVHLNVGYGFELVFNLTPEESKTHYTINLADSNVAFHWGNYFIMGKVPGETMITITTSNGKKGECIVKVYETEAELQGESIKKKTAALDELMEYARKKLKE